MISDVYNNNNNNNNCTKNEKNFEKMIPTFLLRTPCGLSFLFLMSLMVLIKTLIRKKEIIQIILFLQICTGVVIFVINFIRRI